VTDIDDPLADLWDAPPKPALRVHRWPPTAGLDGLGGLIRCEGGACQWCARGWEIVDFNTAVDAIAAGKPKETNMLHRQGTPLPISVQRAKPAKKARRHSISRADRAKATAANAAWYDATHKAAPLLKR